MEEFYRLHITRQADNRERLWMKNNHQPKRKSLMCFLEKKEKESVVILTVKEAYGNDWSGNRNLKMNEFNRRIRKQNTSSWAHPIYLLSHSHIKKEMEWQVEIQNKSMMTASCSVHTKYLGYVDRRQIQVEIPTVKQIRIGHVVIDEYFMVMHHKVHRCRRPRHSQK